MNKSLSEEGRELLAEVEADLAAVDRDAALTVRLDLKQAADRCLDVSARVTREGLKADFEALPARFFDQAALTRLSRLARAGLYAVSASAELESREAEARISVSLLDRAREIKQRMLRVVDYYLGDDALAGPEIASIKEGSGYQDLASDLLRLSRLYRTHEQFLCEDSRRYRSGDERSALEVSDEIVEALRASQSTETARWEDRKRRLAVLLMRDYEELRAAALWIYRREPRKAAHFPELSGARSEV